MNNEEGGKKNQSCITLKFCYTNLLISIAYSQPEKIKLFFFLFFCKHYSLIYSQTDRLFITTLYKLRNANWNSKFGQLSTSLMKNSPKYLHRDTQHMDRHIKENIMLRISIMVVMTMYVANTTKVMTIHSVSGRFGISVLIIIANLLIRECGSMKL